jgi:hypothetical protein
LPLPRPGGEALWRARRTVAFTLAHALRMLPLRTRHRSRRLLLWLVGAREAMEGELVRSGLLLPVLAALCPWPAGWEVRLCGPEMQDWELLQEADGAPCRVCAVSGTLHEVAGDGADEAAAGRGVASLGGAPDAVALLNSGLGTLILPLVEAWLPSLLLLLRMCADFCFVAAAVVVVVAAAPTKPCLLRS